MPTETEIYILPDGQVVIADLPAELSDLVDQLGDVEPCAVESAVVPGAESDTPANEESNNSLSTTTASTHLPSNPNEAA